MTGRALMVQGTASSVGKSVLCAALCRIFHRRGLRVAPFKAQNMSNNAFVTVDGGEISRAQVVQAEAAGIRPTVDMNPILLKPEGDRGSQVVLRGRVWGRLRSEDYLRRKALFWGTVEGSLRSLMAEYDVVVIEGAGSPAEVNLKAGDIVNMRVAEAADAPVLLVGDIDRGGIFASLLGTLDLLEPGERERVRGLIVNRFRGDPGLLRPGVEFLERRSGCPVLGVVPYLPDLGLAEEDAATLEAVARPEGLVERHQPRVATVKLPRVANFDDLDPLGAAGGQVAWVERPSQLGRPDLIVLPGSKNTAADLAWLHETGLADAIVELADRGTPVLGLCGGYQMLGSAVRDPEGVESSRPETPGLNLLPVETTLDPEKTTRQTRGRLLNARGLFAGAENARVEGYEIHVGRTEGRGDAFLELEAPTGPHLDGRSVRSGWIVGTYLHGLLHNRPLAEALVTNLRLRGNGLPPPPSAIGPSTSPAFDPYDRLADAVESALDLPRLLALAGLGAKPVWGGIER